MKRNKKEAEKLQPLKEAQEPTETRRRRPLGHLIEITSNSREYFGREKVAEEKERGGR